MKSDILCEVMQNGLKIEKKWGIRKVWNPSRRITSSVARFTGENLWLQSFLLPPSKEVV